MRGISSTVGWMWLGAVLSAVTVAPEARAQDKPDLAIMPFDKRNVDDELAEALLDAFQVTFVRASGITVVGPAEIATVIGFEKQKELLGCDEGSCFAEIGGALGVRYLISGRFAKFGNSHLVTIRLVDARRTVSILQDQETISSLDDGAFLAGVQNLATRFGREAVEKIRANGGEVKTGPNTAGARTKNGGTQQTAAAPARMVPGPRNRSEPPPSSPGAAPSKTWIGLAVGAGAVGAVSCLTFPPALVLSALGLGATAAGSGYGAIAGLLGVCTGMCWLGTTGACAVLLPLAIWKFATRNPPMPKDVETVSDEKTAPAEKLAAKPEDKPADPPSAEAVEQAKGTDAPDSAAPPDKEAGPWDDLDSPEKADDDDKPKKKKKKKR